MNVPREFAERFCTVRDWQESPAGGHFAACGRQRDYVRGIRSAVSLAAG
ncbi:hypothetical protein OG552_32040 [Streptomyces sp. NBC_01476]|nr:hypothetical protein [Streptomyces sp. NBC_01476]